MKRLLFITFLLSLFLTQVCYADVYSVDINDINKKIIIDKIANDMVSKNGFLISSINDYQAIFKKDMTNFADKLRYGSNYNHVPELRLTCNFTQSGQAVRVTMEPRAITNPGSAFESYTSLQDGTLLDYLTGLKHYFNSRVDTGIAWNIKRKGDLVEVASVAKNSSAEKTGIVAGDLISRVDGVDVKELSMDKFLAMMSGAEGKQIRLTLKRPSGDIQVSVTHSLIPAEYQHNN